MFTLFQRYIKYTKSLMFRFFCTYAQLNKKNILIDTHTHYIHTYSWKNSLLPTCFWYLDKHIFAYICVFIYLCIFTRSYKHAMSDRSNIEAFRPLIDVTSGIHGSICIVKQTNEQHMNLRTFIQCTNTIKKQMMIAELQ